MADAYNAAQVKFLNNLEMELQQQDNPLEMACQVQDDASAELVKVKDTVANKQGQEAGEKYGDTVWEPSQYDGIWIAQPNEIYDAEIVDNGAKLATAIDLGGTAVKNGAGVIQRARVRRILEGFYGPVISGKKATVSTPFPNANYIAQDVGAAAATRMNTAKLRAAKKMLTQAYVPDTAKKWMILTADDNDALLTEVPATSEDFKASFAARVDDQGNLLSMLGFNFIHLELDNPLLGTIPTLATDGLGYRLNPFWAQGGLILNYWQRQRVEVGKLPQKQFNLGYLSGTTCASTRGQAGMSGIIRNVKG